jgi:hypothetical protein
MSKNFQLYLQVVKLARGGYGWEDIVYKLDIEPDLRDWVRRIVLSGQWRKAA